MSEDKKPGSSILSPAFWLMLAFGLTCVLAGAGAALFGPRLFPVAGIGGSARGAGLGNPPLRRYDAVQPTGRKPL